MKPFIKGMIPQDLESNAVSGMAGEYIKNIQASPECIVMKPTFMFLGRSADNVYATWYHMAEKIMTEVLDVMMDQYNIHAEMKCSSDKVNEAIHDFVQVMLMAAYTHFGRCNGDKPVDTTSWKDYVFTIEIRKMEEETEDEGTKHFLKFSTFFLHKVSTRALSYEVYL